MKRIMIRLSVLLVSLLSLNGCVMVPDAYDYSAFHKSKPASILVVMPRNDTNEINASVGVLSYITYPLAEAGYYVFPVVVSDELFKQNGLMQADDIHAVKLSKLYSIFHHDAVLYINVKDYGSRYQLLQSDTRVTLEARLIDAKTGDILWNGYSTASTLEQRQSDSSLLGSMVIAFFDQISNTMTNRSLEMANIAAKRLLRPAPDKYNGILRGPRYIEQHD